MPQVTIYMDEETAARAKASATAEKVSLSKWIADLVRRKTETEWPASVKALAGAWKDLPSAEQLRDDQGPDAVRESM